MNTKKTVKIIICVLIVLICIIIGILFYNKKIVKKEVNLPVEDPIIELQTQTKELAIRNDYYIIKSYVEKFYSYYMTLFNIKEYYYQIDDKTELKNLEKENAIVLYNMLDREYIVEQKITEDNMKEKLANIGKCITNITDIYVSEKTKNIKVYLVQGLLAESTTNNISKFQVLVKQDVINKTLSIMPQEYVEDNKIEIGEDVIVPEAIEKNKNNIYKYNNINDEEYLKDIFNKIRIEKQYFLELMYNNLDEEYKNRKFGTFEEFQKYMQMHNEKFSKIRLKKYQKQSEKNNIRYIGIDEKDNYYIFYETSVMNYKMILDTYTVDLPEFTEKYNNSSEQQKVALNIEKFNQAINDKDYKYAYNCLADSFKNNYFKIQEEFETYIKTNFYTKNKIKYINFEKQGDLCTYRVSITDEETGKQIKKTFIMQLGEGTEFKLSFDK